MPVLLIPVAIVGYKMWERQKKKREQEQAEKNGEPTVVVDSLPKEADEMEPKAEANTLHDTSDETYDLSKLDSDMSADDDDDQSRSTAATNEEQTGKPLSGIRKFFEKKMDERRARELQRQKTRQLAMEIATGKVPGGLPKISYK